MWYMQHAFKPWSQICSRYNSQRISNGFNHQLILHSKEDQEKIIKFCLAINIFMDI